jgi:hypothetical protein
VGNRRERAEFEARRRLWGYAGIYRVGGEGWFEAMKMRKNIVGRVAACCAAVALVAVIVCAPWKRALGGPGGDQKQVPMTKLKISVTAGVDNKPVGNASVYVRVPEEKGGKLGEMNFKTNEDGTVKSPDVPKGKVLIQVVAEGWKTYGKWYDLEKDEEDLRIHLEDRPHWY